MKWPILMEEVIRPQKRTLSSKPDAQHKLILRHLMDNGPTLVEDLTKMLFDNREDGGPLGYRRIISVLICKLNTKNLKPNWYILSSPSTYGRTRKVELIHIDGEENGNKSSGHKYDNNPPHPASTCIRGEGYKRPSKEHTKNRPFTSTIDASRWKNITRWGTANSSD